MMTSDQAAGRQCILEQAERLFFAHGYHAVSVRDIVEACGLAKATLYHHFGSKEQLFAQVVRGFVARIADQLQEAGAGDGTCRERLTNIALSVTQFRWGDLTALQMLLRDLVDSDSEEIQRLIPEIRGQMPALFASVLEEGIAAGEVRPVDTRRTSMILVGMLNALATRRMRGSAPAGTLAENVEYVMSILFEGIGA